MLDVQVLLGATAACAALCAVGVGLLVFRKQVAVHRALEAKIDRLAGASLENLYTQLEALSNLHRDLNFKGSLPMTRGWAASPDFLYIIASHALTARPQVTVECSSGVSTLVLAQCMLRNGGGHIFSLEHDQKFAEQTRKHLTRLGLDQFATVLDAPLKPYRIKGRDHLWYDLCNLNVDHVDLLVIDGPPQDTCQMARYPAGPLLFHRLREGAYVFLDDAARDEERAAVDQWVQEEPLSVVDRLVRTEKGCAILERRTEANKGQAC